MSGPATVFDDPIGLFRAFTDDAYACERFAPELDDLGQRWLLAEAAFKAFPCCHYIQAGLEALARILAGGNPASGTERVDCQLPGEVAWLVCEPWSEKLDPPSGHVARFSLPYCLAALIVDGRVDVATFGRARPDPRLRPMMQRIGAHRRDHVEENLPA